MVDRVDRDLSKYQEALRVRHEHRTATTDKHSRIAYIKACRLHQRDLAETYGYHRVSKSALEPIVL